jgi:hypothetical protein
VNVVINGTITDEWIYEGGQEVPIKTHTDVRSMKIEVNKDNLKIVQHTKTSAHESTSAAAVPNYVEGRKEIADTKMVYREPITDETKDGVIFKWVKAFIEYNYYIVSSEPLSVDGPLECLTIYKQQRVRSN